MVSILLLSPTAIFATTEYVEGGQWNYGTCISYTCGYSDYYHDYNEHSSTHISPTIAEKINQEDFILNSDHKELLPFFSNASQLRIQSLAHFFENSLAQVSGTYSFISKKPFDAENIVNQLSQFYNIPIENLLKQVRIRKSELVNLKLIIVVISFFLLFIIISLLRLIIPLSSLKEIGVKRLLGFKPLNIYINDTLFDWLVIIITIIATNSYLLFTRSYFPQKFWVTLLIFQYSVAVIIFFQTYIINRFKARLPIVNMLKNDYPQIKILTILILGIKLMILAGLMILTYQITELYKENQENIAITKNWQPYTDLVVVDTYFLNHQGESDENIGLKPSMELLHNLYDLTEKDLETYFVYNDAVIHSIPLNRDKLSRDYNYMTINKNYFQKYMQNKQINAQLPQMQDNIILIPKSWQQSVELISELKWIVYSQMSEEIRPSNYNDLELILVPYEQLDNIFTFNTTTPFLVELA